MMTANEQYERLYYDKSEEEALYAAWKALITVANDEFLARQEAEKKRLKRRKPLSIIKDGALLKALKEELLAKHKPAVDAAEQAWKDAKKRRADTLLELAGSVTFTPTGPMVELRSSWTSSYETQGYGKHSYAKGALAAMEAALKARGFSTEIRYEQTHDGGRGMFSTGAGGEYTLCANCPEWMFDALSCVVTLEDVIAAQKAAGVNPLVYNPFLPDRMVW